METRKKKIVIIGGGTGTYTLLSGLKKYNVELTAIVSMFDSGGSTGILRDEFGELPKGDVRRCLIALSDNENHILRKLFEHRFSTCTKTNGLNGHSFGNLFLSALREITGGEKEGLKEASRLLGIKGTVLPVTFDNCHLRAELENGRIIKGETNIDTPKHDGNIGIKKIFLDKKARLNEEIPPALTTADLIIIGPGDLYTSVLPNFLVEGLAKAVNESKAKKVYACNLMTKFGETNGYSASNFVSRIMEYVKIDTVILNSKEISPELLERYAGEESYPVVVDKENLPTNIEIIQQDVMREPELVRHDSDKIAKLILEFT